MIYLRAKNPKSEIRNPKAPLKFRISDFRFRFFLLLVPLVLLPTLVGPSYAGIFFGRKNKKPTPAERVPELLAQVKTDGDESKRAAAAQELRQYDPAQFPMIVPILVDVLLTDSKPVVRAEAAQSIGKIRPVSQQAGMALEQALSNDSSMRVRLQARSSLLQYHWSGYHSVRKDDLVPQTKEPPLADEKAPPVISTTTQPPVMNRLVPRQADGSRTLSGYRPAAPAPFPVVPPRQTGNEPPLAPSPTPAPPTNPPGDGGPQLTPP
ncbi:MAG TPA: HEAT repeat domain-containing protein [Gemmataceae bacterium]|nr:HEAT repeat domain-containing protein [Gemmataceae bacterium]